MIAPVFIAIINAYKRFISPLLPGSCRFYPSCADYARAALEKHGALRGSGLAVKRLCKCHPFHPGGVDHVPDRGTHNLLKKQTGVME